MRITTLLPWAIGVLSLAIAALAAAYAIEAAFVQSAHPVSFLPLPLTAAYDAEAALSLDADPVRAKAASMKALAISPADARAWLNLARLDARPAGRLSPSGVADLERSYDMVPYDPQLIADRVSLVYDHWSELSSDIHEETLSEVRTAWPFADQRNDVFAAAKQATSPTGKLALALEMFQLRMSSLVAKEPALSRAAKTKPGRS